MRPRAGCCIGVEACRFLDWGQIMQGHHQKTFGGYVDKIEQSFIAQFRLSFIIDSPAEAATNRLYKAKSALINATENWGVKVANASNTSSKTATIRAPIEHTPLWIYCECPLT